MRDTEGRMNHTHIHTHKQIERQTAEQHIINCPFLAFGVPYSMLFIYSIIEQRPVMKAVRTFV